MTTVQLAGEIYPSFNSTNGIAVDIYLAGCARNPKCEGCHNPLLWDFSYGRTILVSELVKLIQYKYKDADSIAIMGGEPVNQPNIVDMLKMIKQGNPEKGLWLYTSYEFTELDTDTIAQVDFVKTGRFMLDQQVKGRLASANQKVWRKHFDTEGFVFRQVRDWK